MTSLIARLSPLLHLTRITAAFAVTGNVLFVVLWTRSVEAERDALASVRGIATGSAPLLLALTGGLFIALGFYAFAMVVNDIMDFRRDRSLHPDRPLPAGRVSLDAALGLTVSTILLALLGALMLGTEPAMLAIVTAAAILLFNASAKFLPSVGLVLLGLIYAAHMLIANPQMLFLWPVWLAMTHTLAVGAFTHHLAGRRPTLNRQTLVLAVLGWLFWSMVLAGLSIYRNGSLWPDFVPGSAAIAPALLAGLYLLFAFSKMRSTRSASKAADKVQRYGALWLPMYAAAWCFGAGLLWPGVTLALLSIIGLLGMTILRELYSLVEHPIGYRR
jgi:4-hydroxybenzoate polyprenyltransferase